MNGIDLIYRTAGKLFADKGFGSVSMGEIAEKCKMSKANLYHHFSSKNDLYEKIILRALQNTSDILDKAEQIDDNYVNKIKFTAKEHLNQLILNSQEYKLLARESSDLGNKDRTPFSIGLFQQNLSQMINLIEQAKKNKEIIEQCDSRILAFQLISPNFSYLVFQRLFTQIFEELDDTNYEHFSETLTENLLNGIVRK
tara:strand:+ start:648 stop:1241 length:594 start_codon:yes stop_codon:yes gene_type:complete